ncbi:MAG: two pore domain potassium channel family protein [Phycisphaerae bacterium]|nr:two pore domain potassium channel family protein [Phycisphaerae bacterium]
MRDFLGFLRHLFKIAHFIRGVLVVFVLLLALCVAVVVLAEGMPIAQGVYLVLITALTIGYGDITPGTAWGRVASIAAGFIGLLFNGIVVAVAVHALSQAVQEKRREEKADG